MAIWLRLLYATNLILLSLHEMDAVHWREWTLFGIGDDAVGRPVFLLAHVPLLALVLAGFALLDRRSGQALSLALGAFLVAHFLLHRSLAPHAFTGPLSSGIILAMLIVGAAQGVLSLAALRSGADPLSEAGSTPGSARARCSRSRCSPRGPVAAAPAAPPRRG